ncbi:DNA primase, partial [Candidimonas humi]
MIPESFVQDLLARVDVVDVVGRYVQLRKGGANLLGLCPFHNEKSPSFTVSPTKQFYHCFGCGAHGTAITFLIEHTGASFPEAVRALAGNVGMTVPEEPRSPRQQAASRRRKEEVSRHQQVLETAQAQYLRLLKGSEAAIAYLKRRGLTGAIAARFGLGWSGTDRRGLAAVFPHYEDPTLVESGLVIEAEDGRRYDRFRERVMFPIRNARGKLIGFGGRIIGKGEPKYLNSPETPLFSKGQELYGLWEARAGIRAQGCVLVVEGYMDVVGLAQLGVENAVATLGTATTADHIQKLLRTSDRIIFSFDGDAAGRRAAWRALQACLPMLRDDVSVRFLFLPPEHDPDSYVREFGAEAFRACMDDAVPLSRFLMEELAARHPMDEAEGRAACVHEARPLLAMLPEGTTLRLQIEREFARQVLLTPEELAAMLAAQPPGRQPLAVAAGRQANAAA